MAVGDLTYPDLLREALAVSRRVGTWVIYELSKESNIDHMIGYLRGRCGDFQRRRAHADIKEKCADEMELRADEMELGAVEEELGEEELDEEELAAEVEKLRAEAKALRAEAKVLRAYYKERIAYWKRAIHLAQRMGQHQHQRLARRIIKDIERDTEYRQIPYVATTEIAPDRAEDGGKLAEVPRRGPGKPRLEPLKPIDFRACDRCKGEGFFRKTGTP